MYLPPAMSRNQEKSKKHDQRQRRHTTYLPRVHDLSTHQILLSLFIILSSKFNPNPPSSTQIFTGFLLATRIFEVVDSLVRSITPVERGHLKLIDA